MGTTPWLSMRIERVSAHPDAVKGLGMDGVLWAKEGLVGMLTPCPLWTTSDFDIPVELWKERIGEAVKHVVIAPGLEHNTRAYNGAAPISNDMNSTRGFAASAWNRSADQTYLFNYLDLQTRPVNGSDYRVLIENSLGKDVVHKLSRHHIQSYRDTVPTGFDSGAALPVETNTVASFRLHIGTRPTKGRVLFIAGIAERDRFS